MKTGLSELKTKAQQYGFEQAFDYYPAVYDGICKDNQDEKKQNRILVESPIFRGQAVWCMPRNAYGGKGKHNLTLLPEKGDNIHLSFKYGRLAFPLWEFGQLPVDSKPDESEGQLLYFQSPNGHTISLNDESGLLEIKMTDGRLVKIDNEGDIELSNGDTKHLIKEASHTISNESHNFAELIGELFDWLNEAKVPTSLGAMQFLPPQLVALAQIKAKFENLFT